MILEKETLEKFGRSVVGSRSLDYIVVQCDSCGKIYDKHKRSCYKNYSGLCMTCFAKKRAKAMGDTYGKAQQVEGTCHFCGQGCRLQSQKKLPCCDNTVCIEKRRDIIKSSMSARMSGENNPAYSGRKLRCECGKKLKYNTKQCRKCSFESGARSGANNGRWKEDKSYKLAASLARRMIHNMKHRMGYKKTTKTEKILGYTFQDFKENIESKFEPWMNWDNHGLGDNKWSIDHIIPVAALIRASVRDPAVINALWNLKPMQSKDNIKKSDSITQEAITLAKEKLNLDLNQGG